MIYNPGRPLLIQGPSSSLKQTNPRDTLVLFFLKHAFGVLANGAVSHSLTDSLSQARSASLQLSCCRRARLLRGRSTQPAMQQQPPPPPSSSSSGTAAGGGAEAVEDPFDDYDIVIPPDLFMELDHDGGDECSYGATMEDAKVGAGGGGGGEGDEEDDRLSLVYKGFSYVFDDVPPQKVRGLCVVFQA